MFGFMRNRECEHHSPLAPNYRLHYCGTCKTMGTLYGQKTRPLLNFDTVFLSELLAALGNEQQNHWNESYQSKNCFQLPQNQADMPLSLQFSATVNVLLAELKTEDNVQDNASITAKALQKFYAASFQKAENQMKTWGLDTDLLWQEMQAQTQIEKNYTQHTDFAAPTANMTALIFEKGAEVVGNESAKSQMFAFGKIFGEMIYWLDALEDFEKDAKQKQFNAIRAKYALKSTELSAYYRQLIIRMLCEKEKEIHSIFQTMPLSPATAKAFCNRFSLNLAAKLSAEEEKESAFKFEWQAIQHFWQTRKAQAFSFAKTRISAADSWQQQIQLNAWLLAAFIAPDLPKNLPAPDGEKHNLTFWAVLAALLGTLGVGRKAAKSCKNGKCGSNSKRLMQVPFGGKKDACGDCCSTCVSDCCTQCGQECCEQCGQACCSSVCDTCCESACQENSFLSVLGAIFLALLVIGAIVLIALYAK